MAIIFGYWETQLLLEILHVNARKRLVLLPVLVVDYIKLSFDNIVGKAGMGESSMGKGSVCEAGVSDLANWGGSNLGNWGSCDSLVDGDWVRDGVGLLLDDWGLNDVLDLVDWVWLWDSDWGWDLNVVVLWDVLLDNDLPLDWGWDSDWDWDLVVLDPQFWLDPGGLWGDGDVGPGGGQDFLNGHGVSWGWAKVDWCWWDGSSWGWHWDGWDGQGLGDDLVGGWGVDMGESGSLGHVLASLDVLVSDLDSPGAGWDLTVSHHSMLNMGLGNGWSGMDSLVDGGGSSTVSNNSGVCEGSEWGMHACVEQVGGSSTAQSGTESQNQK